MNNAQVRMLFLAVLFCASSFGVFLAAEPGSAASQANCKVCGAAIKADGSKAGISCLEFREEGYKDCKVTKLEGQEAASCSTSGGTCPSGGGGGGIDPS